MTIAVHVSARPRSARRAPTAIPIHALSFAMGRAENFLDAGSGIGRVDNVAPISVRLDIPITSNDVVRIVGNRVGLGGCETAAIALASSTWMTEPLYSLALLSH